MDLYGPFPLLAARQQACPPSQTQSYQKIQCPTKIPIPKSRRVKSQTVRVPVGLFRGRRDEDEDEDPWVPSPHLSRRRSQVMRRGRGGGLGVRWRALDLRHISNEQRLILLQPSLFSPDPDSRAGLAPLGRLGSEVVGGGMCSS